MEDQQTANMIQRNEENMNDKISELETKYDAVDKKYRKVDKFLRSRGSK